jgi:ribosomal-protein-alanine N-acetyltransferase
VQAGVFEHNFSSARALEKAGYVMEGRLRKKLYAQDKWQDHLLYGILNEDDLLRKEMQV